MEEFFGKIRDVADLKALAEEYDARCGELLGNYPQAFSHLALIRAAEALS